MKHRLLLLLLLLSAWAARAQAPAWQSVTGNNAAIIRGSAVDANGDYYVIGQFNGSLTLGSFTLTSQGDPDIFVAKMSGSTQNWLWAKSGGGGGTDDGRSVAVSGGNVYVTGYYTGTATISGTTMTSVTNPALGSGSSDVYVAKYLTDGTERGAVSGGGSSSDQGLSIAALANGGTTSIYVTGFISTSTSSPTGVTISGSALGNNGGQDIFVARYTDTGSGLTNGGAVSSGTTGLDRGLAIGVNSNGVYVSGYFNSASTVTISGTSFNGQGSSDLFVAKYTATLGNAGAVSGGGSGADQAQALTVTSNEVYVAGIFNATATIANASLTASGSSGSSDVFLAGYVSSSANMSNAGSYAIRDGGGDTEVVSDIAVNGTSVYIGGYYLNVPTTLAGSTLSSNGGGYLAKYIDTGSTFAGISAIRGGTDSNTTVSTISLNNTQLFAAGELSAPTTFAPSTTGGSISVGSGTAYTAFVTPPAPTLASINPTSGPVGTSVTLTGANLTGATAITFSGSSNNTVTSGITVGGSGNSQTITVNVPSGAVTGNVTVTTPGGTSNGVAFTVVQPTTVVSLTRVGASPTNAGTVNYTLTFANPVTGLSLSNFSITTTGLSGASLGTITGSGTTYTVPVNTGTGSGTLTLNLANAMGITPGVTNVPFAGETYTIDKTAPTVSISSTAGTSGNTTSTSPIPFTVTFSKNVTGFVQGDLTVTGGTVSGFSGSGSTYTFNVTPTSSGTTVTVNVPANTAQDAAGNGNTASSSFSLTYQQPLVATAQNVTVQLDANGNGTLNASNVNNNSTGPGTLTYTIQKIVYGRVVENNTLTLSTPNGVNFTAIRFASFGTPTNDPNGNYRLGSCNAANSVTTAQNSYVGRNTGNMDATNGSSVNNNPTLGDPCSGTPKALAVQAAYSADAASLTYDCTEANKTQYVLLTVTNGTSTNTSVAQVTVNPPATATLSSLSPNPAQAGATVTVSGTNLSGLTSVTLNGTPLTPSNKSATSFQVTLPSTATTGPLTVSLPCSQTLTSTLTITQPTVTAVTGLTPSPTATGTVSYQVTFSASVSGLTTSNFNLTTSGLSGASVVSVSGSGTTYTVVVNTGTGNGTLRLNVDNSTGVMPAVTGLPYTSGPTYTITKNFAAAPTLRIKAGGSTSGKTDVTAFVDGVQVVQNGTSTTVANALQNGSFETNNLGSNDYLYPNSNPAVSAAPWAFASQAGVARIGGGGFTPAASGQGSFVGFLQTSGGNSGSVAQNLAVPTGTYQVNFVASQRGNQSQGVEDQVVNVFLNDGTNDVFIGTIQPTSSTAYATFTSATFTVTAPALTATVSTTSGSSTSTSPIPFSVSFSQSVGTTFTASDVTVTGGTLNTASFSGSGSGPYTFTVTPSGAGTVSVSLAANVANDANNTPNSASNSVSVQFRLPATAAPVVTGPANGSLLNTTTPLYSGTAPAGSTVTVYVDGSAIGTTTASGGSFNLNQPTALAQGSHTVYATAQSSGATVSPTSNTNTFTVDSVPPTVAISSTAGTSGSTTSTSPIPFTVTFSENVTGFVQGDLTVSNGSVSSFAGSGSTYSFNVTPTTAGTATTVSVPANVAQDAAGNLNTASSPYSLTFTAPAVTVGPPSLPGGTVGVAYSQTLTATGGSGSYTYTLSGTLPSGLSFSGNTISGTPTASGTFNFRVTATDNSAAPGPYSGFRDYSLTIVRPTITVNPASLPGGTVGVAYSQTLTASGGTGSYTYAITAGATPNGLTISPSGVLSGTPTAAGTFNFTVTATDAFGSPGSQPYTVVISAPTITVNPASLPGGTQGVAYSQTLTASGGTGSYTYAITAGALPSGLTISSSGVLSGTPMVNGSFGFTVTARDAFGSPGSRGYTLPIAAPAVTSVVWSGSVSTDWFTAGNWMPNQVPDATIDVTIPTSPSGNRFPAISSGTANTRNLTLNSGASLTQTGGTLALAANLTNNGNYQSIGGTADLGSTAQSSILGSSNTRFFNLTVGASGAQSSTSASTSVQSLLTLNGSFTTNSNPFTLESNSVNTAMVVNNGSAILSGSASFQRYIDPGANAGLGYRHFAAPTSNATVASLTTSSFSPVVNPAYNTSPQPGTVTPFPTVYGYDQARLATATNNLSAFDKGWFSPTTTGDALTVGQGYTVNLGANQTVSFSGPQNNAASQPISLMLTRNAAGTPNAADAGFQLVGNPFPSPLDYSQVAAADRTNLDPAIYVFTSASQYTGSYRTVLNGVGGSTILPMAQGFFVHVANGTTSAMLNFRNSQRVTSYVNPAFQRTAETRPLVQLTLKGTASPYTDDAYVYFEQGATDDYESAFDALKLPNSTGLNLSTSLAGKQLAIDGRQPLGNTQRVVPLAVGVPAVGSYTFTASQLLNLSNVPVYLRDLQTGALIDLAQQPSYQFTVSNASALIQGRFELVVSPQQPLATAPAALAQQVGLYPNPAKTTAFLELPASLGRQVVTATLVDALGRVARTVVLPAQGALAHTLDLHELATGVYALRLTTSAGTIVKRLTVE